MSACHNGLDVQQWLFRHLSEPIHSCFIFFCVWAAPSAFAKRWQLAECDALDSSLSPPSCVHPYNRKSEIRFLLPNNRCCAVGGFWRRRVVGRLTTANKSYSIELSVARSIQETSGKHVRSRPALPLLPQGAPPALNLCTYVLLPVRESYPPLNFPLQLTPAESAAASTGLPITGGACGTKQIAENPLHKHEVISPRDRSSVPPSIPPRLCSPFTEHSHTSRHKIIPFIVLLPAVWREHARGGTG